MGEWKTYRLGEIISMRNGKNVQLVDQNTQSTEAMALLIMQTHIMLRTPLSSGESVHIVATYIYVQVNAGFPIMP